MKSKERKSGKPSAQLTLWSAASPSFVKTYRAPEKVKALLANAPVCGGRCSGSLMKCDPVGCSLKMSLLSELEELTKSLAAWKESATPAGRSWWVLMTLGRRTDESESGSLPTPTASNTKAVHLRSGGRPPRSYLPTPAANSYGTNQGGSAGRNGKIRPSLETMARRGVWPTPTAGDGIKGCNQPDGKRGAALIDVIRNPKMWPTPRASPNENRQTKPTPSQLAGKHGMNLATAVNLWPTPTVSGNYNQKGMSKNSGDGLATAVAKFPTPTSSMMTIGDMEQARYAGNDPRRPTYAEANKFPTPRAEDSQCAGGHGDKDDTLYGAICKPKDEMVNAPGQLNPNFVEFLQGYPKDWTKVDE